MSVRVEARRLHLVERFRMTSSRRGLHPFVFSGAKWGESRSEAPDQAQTGMTMAKVRDFMSHPPITISSVALVREAAEKMRSADVGALIVQEDGKPYGIVTDRD